MKSNRKSDFLFWNNAYNWKNNCNNSDKMQNNSIWAELFGHFRQHRQLPQCPISSLQPTEAVYMEMQCLARTYTDRNHDQPNQIMRIIEINNAYNSTGTLPQAAFHSVCVPSGQCRWAGILHRPCQVIPPCLGQELLSAPCHFPDASTLS